MPLEYMHSLACSCPVGMMSRALVANPVAKTGAGHLCSQEAQILKGDKVVSSRSTKGHPPKSVGPLLVGDSLSWVFALNWRHQQDQTHARCMNKKTGQPHMSDASMWAESI